MGEGNGSGFRYIVGEGGGWGSGNFVDEGGGCRPGILLVRLMGGNGVYH